MRPRISIKALLLLVAAIAAACGWYVSQAAERNRELAAIARLGELAAVSVEQPGSLFGYCGQWSGVKVRLRDDTPWFLRRIARSFDVDVCYRVESVAFVGAAGTDLIATLAEFSQLKSVTFGVDWFLPYKEAETICHQLELYAALNPQIEVDYPSDIAEIYRPRFDPSDPFGDPDDPFGDPDDPFANPGLGMDARTLLEMRTRAADGSRPLFSSDDLGSANPFGLDSP